MLFKILCYYLCDTLLSDGSTSLIQYIHHCLSHESQSPPFEGGEQTETHMRCGNVASSLEVIDPKVRAVIMGLKTLVLMASVSN